VYEITTSAPSGWKTGRTNLEQAAHNNNIVRYHGKGDADSRIIPEDQNPNEDLFYALLRAEPEEGVTAVSANRGLLKSELTGNLRELENTGVPPEPAECCLAAARLEKRLTG